MAATRKNSNACSIIFPYFIHQPHAGLGSILLIILCVFPTWNSQSKEAWFMARKLISPEAAYICFITSGKRSIEIEFILWLAIWESGPSNGVAAFRLIRYKFMVERILPFPFTPGRRRWGWIAFCQSTISINQAQLNTWPLLPFGGFYFLCCSVCCSPSGWLNILFP